MRWWFVLLVGCGRVGFDPFGRTGDGGADSPRDGVTIDGAVVPPGPAVWLRMETDPNVMIVDSGGGHTVTCATSCPVLAAGERGMGYRFTSSEIDVKPAPDLDPSAGFTAAIWINVPSIPASTVCPWNKTFDAQKVYDTFALCIDTSGMAVYDCETPGGTAVSETSGTVVTDGRWHHVAMTWDGTVKRDYFDGVQVGGGSLTIGAANMGLSLGAAGASFFVSGTLDEALYYTRALTAAEIGQLATP